MRSFSVLARPPRAAARCLGLTLVFLLAVSLARGQQPAAGKRPVTHKDYDNWRSIQGRDLSPNGKFLAYTLSAKGGGETVLRNLETGQEWRFARGGQAAPGEADKEQAPPKIPAKPGPGKGGGGFGGLAGGSIAFTADSRFAVFQLNPTKAELEKASFGDGHSH